MEYSLALDVEVDKKTLRIPTESNLWQLLTRLDSFFTERRLQSYIVGGFVRDALLGRETADIDIAISGNTLEIAPQAAEVLNGSYVLLDEVNGLGRVVIGAGENIPGKKPWNIDLATMKGTIEEDLAQRDFTIDAMAIDLLQLSRDTPDTPLIDPRHGWEDIQQRIVRAVNGTVFQADAARLLRAVRLSAELGFGIDTETEALIRRNAHLAASVAGERTREELLRLLAIPRAGQFLSYLDGLGLLTVIVPELARTKGVTQPKEHFWNVFEHSVQTVVAIELLLRQGSWQDRKHTGEEILAPVPWSTSLAQHFDTEVSYGSTRGQLLKLAALLHDIAKPQTRAVDASGRLRFLGHADGGAIIATDIMERLRFSSRETRLVATAIKHHLRPGQITNDLLPSHKAIYHYFRDTGDTGIDIAFLSLADHLATRGPKLIMTHWQRHTEIVNYILTQRFEQAARVTPPKLIDGHDLINAFGMQPGPEIGELLERIHEAQASGELNSREEALAYIRERLPLTGGRR